MDMHKIDFKAIAIALLLGLTAYQSTEALTVRAVNEAAGITMSCKGVNSKVCVTTIKDEDNQKLLFVACEGWLRVCKKVW